MLHNSLGKLKNTGKWQFALHLFLNKGIDRVLNVVCKANPRHCLAKQIHCFPASWATLDGQCQQIM